MSWGTDFTADMHLSRQVYHSIYEVEETIEELKELNQDIKERMLMLLLGGVNSVNLNDCEGNPCDGVDVLHNKFCELLNLYNENNGQIYDLTYYKKYLEGKRWRSLNV